ncbi:MAG: trypsin-like serine protease [Proteobacteria bacterium]|nr:trypsin-like serine protease [Pseudomonadota bacterium]
MQSYEVTSIDWQVDPSYVQLPKTLLLAITGRYEDGSIDRWSCTGFFLNESNLIATAAHCVKPKVPVKEMWVNAWAGVHRRDGGATVRPFSYGIVDGGVVHPSYDPTSQTTPLTTRFDVAALKIKPDYFSSISRATRDFSARYFMRHMRNVDFSIPYRQFGYGVDLDGINTETERKLLGRKDTPFSPYIVYYYFANMQLYPGDSGSPIFQWAALPPNYPNPGDNTIGIVSAQPKDGSCGAYVAPLGDDYLDLILQVTQ